MKRKRIKIKKVEKVIITAIPKTEPQIKINESKCKKYPF